MSTTLTITLSDDDAALIERGLTVFNQHESTTHGVLTLESLTTLLLEDVALAVRRPGSWEGHNMLQVLTGHGYAT